MVKKTTRLRRPKRKPQHLAIMINGIATPRTEQDQKFCAAWLMHYDHIRAAKEAGYTTDWYESHGAIRIYRKYEQYLLQMKQKKELAVAKEMALEQKDILSEMMAIGFANAQDYVKEEERMVDGKLVKCHVRKMVSELTRRQASAISKVTFHPNGTVSYDLPDEKSKHPYLKDLGQHLGLFHPRLIQEHRHAHMHAALSFKDMDMKKLAEAEQMMIAALGPEGKRMLGILEGEFEDVTDQE